jgi:hypothetical protein
MNDTINKMLGSGKYTFTTLFFLVQRAEIYLNHRISIMLNSDFTGAIVNCDTEDEEIIFYFENIRELFDFFMESGSSQN